MCRLAAIQLPSYAYLESGVSAHFEEDELEQIEAPLTLQPPVGCLWAPDSPCGRIRVCRLRQQEKNLRHAVLPTHLGTVP